jgi:hypothetical protein
MSSTWQRLAGFKRSDGVPVLHTEDGLLGMANPAQVTPQDTAESHSFSVTSAQNKEGISNEGAGVSRGSGTKNVIFFNRLNFLSECSKLLY